MWFTRGQCAGWVGKRGERCCGIVPLVSGDVLPPSLPVPRSNPSRPMEDWESLSYLLSSLLQSIKSLQCQNLCFAWSEIAWVFWDKCTMKISIKLTLMYWSLRLPQHPRTTVLCFTKKFGVQVSWHYWLLTIFFMYYMLLHGTSFLFYG